MSLYQAFLFDFYVRRGEWKIALDIASLPPECFRWADDMMEAAYALGAAMKRRD